MSATRAEMISRLQETRVQNIHRKNKPVKNRSNTKKHISLFVQVRLWHFCLRKMRGAHDGDSSVETMRNNCLLLPWFLPLFSVPTGADPGKGASKAARPQLLKILLLKIFVLRGNFCLVLCSLFFLQSPPGGPPHHPLFRSSVHVFCLLYSLENN